ncbi:type II toxin-antitoxin system antitoxin MazE9 [soil metagenome]
MKLSVSLSEDDVAVLDAYVEQTGLPSRSAAVQRAVQMLRHPTLEKDYEHAWEEWSESGESEVWESSIGDGVDNATR